MLAFVWDGTQFVYAFSANKGNNDFFRYNPQGKGLFHNQDKDGVTAYYCSDWDMESMTCNTALFAGPARLTAIGSSDNAIIYDCPFSIRVTGLLADLAGTGDQVDVQAHWRYVQNQDECREAMVKIEADPIE